MIYQIFADRVVVRSFTWRSGVTSIDDAIRSPAETVTTDNVTAAFDHPIEVDYTQGRWTARTKASRIDL